MNKELYVKKEYKGEKYRIVIIEYNDESLNYDPPSLTFIWFKKMYNNMGKLNIFSLIDKYNIVFNQSINIQDFSRIDVKGAMFLFNYKHEAQKFLDEIIIPIEIERALTKK